MPALSLAAARLRSPCGSTDSDIRTAHFLGALQPFTAADADAIKTHLLTLDGDDRLLRFGYGIADEGIARYVAGIDFERDHVVGLGNRAGCILALAHVGIRDGETDFGLSVVSALRGCGLGKLLFSYVIELSRLAGARRIICHSISPAVMHMAVQHGFRRSEGKPTAPLVLALPLAKVPATSGRDADDHA